MKAFEICTESVNWQKYYSSSDSTCTSYAFQFIGLIYCEFSIIYKVSGHLGE